MSIEKETPVNYRTGDGRLRPAIVLQVDRTIQPPSYMIKFTDEPEGSVRSTEGDRLTIQPGWTPPSKSPTPPPSAPSSPWGIGGGSDAAKLEAAGFLRPRGPPRQKESQESIARKAALRAMDKSNLGSREEVRQLNWTGEAKADDGPPGSKPRSLSQLLQAGQKAEEARREAQKKEMESRQQKQKEKDMWQCMNCTTWNLKNLEECPSCKSPSPQAMKPWRCQTCSNFNGRERQVCNGKKAHKCKYDETCRECNSGEECGKPNPITPAAKRQRMLPTEKVDDSAVLWGGASKAVEAEPAGVVVKVSTNPVPSPLPAAAIQGTVKLWDVERCRGSIIPDDFGAEVFADKSAFKVGGDAPSAKLIPGKKVTFLVTAARRSLVARAVTGEGVGGVGPLERLQGWWLRPGGKEPCAVRGDGEVIWGGKEGGGGRLVLDESTGQVTLSDWVLLKEEYDKGQRKLHWVKTNGELRVWYGHPWPVLEIPLTPPAVKEPLPWANCQQRIVFLLLGAGNMAGRGTEAALAPQCSKAWVLNEVGEWTPGVEPVTPFDGNGQGCGPGVAIARRLTDALPNAGFFLVPCAAEPSSVNDWAEGLPLFEAAIARARLACKACDGGIGGVFWHQGEADATPETWPAAKGYADPLRQIAGAFRRRLAAPSMPFISASLGAYLERVDEPPVNRRPTMWRHVNNALAMSTGRGPGAVPCSSTVSADGLQAEGMYLDTTSQIELGKRLGEAWLSCAGAPETARYRDGKAAGIHATADLPVPPLPQPPPLSLPASAATPGQPTAPAAPRRPILPSAPQRPAAPAAPQR
eukprot:TRINITY_DN12006_c0_g1_i1.p1 TRINITY_DN12006_c0_g1~~TRINITY_DN12006_c0_g1_i1.p1  ORF type:complete len:833 (+),score=214.99 TRINITY_DN12006_c0_g1_i1:78-2501(+)